MIIVFNFVKIKDVKSYACNIVKIHLKPC